MGAAGLTCSTSEMAEAGDSGIEIELSKVPRREEGMEPWEVMMSESQERMLVCIKKGKEGEIEKIFEKWDLHGVVIGYVIKEDLVRIKDNGVVVAEASPKSLASSPVYDMPYEKPKDIDEINKLDLSKISKPTDYNFTLIKLLSSLTIASKEWVYEQYDHMVQTNTIVLPGSDAAVIRLKGRDKALAATSDCNSRYVYLNPYRGTQIAIAEAARNLVCSGAEPAAVTDCLNFANPEKPDRYWYFRNAIEGIVDACKKFNIAVVSGNVSFYNESTEGPINPTPTIGMMGVVKKLDHVTTQYFKDSDDIIILLGKTKEELGGTEYLKVIHDKVRGDAPELDLTKEIALGKVVLDAIGKGLVKSAHDCSEGGLAVAIAESCISGTNPIGAKVYIDTDIREDALLFGESQSRIILTCKKENAERIESLAKKNKIDCTVIGAVGGDILEIVVNSNKLIDKNIKEFESSWRNALKKELEQE